MCGIPVKEKKGAGLAILKFTKSVDSVFARFDWRREGILGRWPRYVNFTQVISRGCNETKVYFLRSPHILIDCLKRLQNHA